MKPKVTCHMANSIDGRILLDRWIPNDAHAPRLYDDVHRRLGGGSWIVGRVTAQEFAKREPYPETGTPDHPLEAWLTK